MRRGHEPGQRWVAEDLAIIQLKKVLSLNSRLVKAHRLLALLYIKTENYERAGRELKRALNIDRTDTLSLQYQQELDEILAQEEDGEQTQARARGQRRRRRRA